MADEQQEVRRIHWNEVLAVTHVFKSFRMAIHFSKLVLALAAVVLIWLWGWTLDVVGGPVCGVYVRPGEVSQHVSRSPAAFAKLQEAAQAGRATKIDQLWGEADRERKSLTAFRRLLGAEGGGGSDFETALVAKANEAAPEAAALPDAEARMKRIDASWLGIVGDIETIHAEEIGRIEKLIPQAEEAAEEKLKKEAKDRSEAEEKLAEDVQAARRAVTLRRLEMARKVRDVRGVPVFAAFRDYEKHCLSSALYAVRHGNVLGNVGGYRQMLANRSRMLPAPAPTHGLGGLSPAPADDPPGFVYWLLLAMHGFCWLAAEHWLYAILLLGGALAIWALFGGAIHRIAALHFARDEKISISQALRFSASKFLSFVTAPLIPIAIILVIGVFMILGGLLMSVPGLDLLMGVLFPLAILGGMLIAFLLVGLGGGGLMMYPTIAVESSDSFDAISRSYSYLFGRPWRAAFYGLAALVYGTVCYLFVRLFAFLVLSSAHTFVGAGVIGGGGAVSPAADKLDVLWPAPTYDALMPAWQTQAMGGWETVVAWVVQFWVFLTASLVLAFLWSYVSSASTVVYFLLRRQVDATDLDDVYVEEPEEEPIVSAPEPEAPETEGAETETSEAEEPAEEPQPGEAEGDEKPAGDGEAEPAKRKKRAKKSKPKE